MKSISSAALTLTLVSGLALLACGQGIPDARVNSQESHAKSALRILGNGAEGDFRANDRDENGVKDYWVGDVSGLYRYQGSKEIIGLMARNVAEADAAPLDIKELAAHTVAKPRPAAGYLFVALQKYSENGKTEKYDQGNYRNKTRFGFAAYTVGYPKEGKLTFIVNESGTMYQKDTGGKPPEVFPEDPAKDGWAKVPPL